MIFANKPVDFAGHRRKVTRPFASSDKNLDDGDIETEAGALPRNGFDITSLQQYFMQCVALHESGNGIFQGLERWPAMLSESWAVPHACGEAVSPG